jgi:peptidoglycan/LPS O-acetylase OafA/YrhL
MVLFMAYHLGVSRLQGAWVGINLFFVLSGYLIVRLLTAEHYRWGSIEVVSFYRRRVRRLLPALALLLLALIAYALTFGSLEGRRRMPGDIVATAFYVMNWRLASQNNQYFDEFGEPSYLKHAWTLSVEEQFYLLVPFLLIGLFAWLHSRRSRVAVLLALAVLCALWGTRVGVDGLAAQAHSYYGTDVRMQSLLVGAALGVWFAPTARGRGPRRLPQSVLAAVGWAGLAFMGFAYLCIAPFAPWMFTKGGMLLSSVAAAGLVTACADPRPSTLKSALGWAPFAYVGKLSYGLYLWHWPVHLWLTQAVPTLPMPAHLGLGLVITLGLAVLSYELLEKRVVREGLRALVPSVPAARLVAAVTATAVLVGAWFVGRVPPPLTPEQAAKGPIPDLVAGQAPYVAPTAPLGVAVYGDSVPYFLAERFPAARFPGFKVTNLAKAGCDILDPPLQWTADKLAPNAPDCAQLKKDLPNLVRASGADTLMVFGSPLMAIPHRTEQGVLQANDAAYVTLLRTRLDTVRRQALGAGVRHIVLADVPCRRVDPEAVPAEYREAFRKSPHLVALVDDPAPINAILRSWAAQYQDVKVLDLYDAICGKGFHERVHDIELYNDKIHFSPEATPMVWKWLAPQVVANAGGGG